MTSPEAVSPSMMTVSESTPMEDLVPTIQLVLGPTDRVTAGSYSRQVLLGTSMHWQVMKGTYNFKSTCPVIVELSESDCSGGDQLHISIGLAHNLRSY